MILKLESTAAPDVVVVVLTITVLEVTLDVEVHVCELVAELATAT